MEAVDRVGNRRSRAKPGAFSEKGGDEGKSDPQGGGGHEFESSDERIRLRKQTEGDHDITEAM